MDAPVLKRPKREDEEDRTVRVHTVRLLLGHISPAAGAT